MIKVTLGEVKPQEEKPFPKLMTLIENGGVFWFINKTDVLCLSKGRATEWKSNEYYDNADIRFFTDYNEPITIQNA